jgi:alpha 1,2-mannosyltransferase
VLDCPPPNLHGGTGFLRFDAINEAPRQTYIANDDEIKLPMQAAHDGSAHAICNSKLDRAYVSGTMGIVSSAGGIYLPTFYGIALFTTTDWIDLARGVMKDRTEYEPSICEAILPLLGVKCLVLSEILAGQDNSKSTHNIDEF